MTEEYTEEKYNKEEKNTFKTFYWILAGAIVIMIAAPILIHNFSGADDTTRGTFGDMYGMVNALFSGLATGGVILAILLQRLDLKIQRQELKNSIEQLELQREEMQLQRLEMQQSTAEIRAQKEILDRQNFEDKFFRLVENFSKNVSSFRYTEHDPRTIEYTGYEALNRYLFGTFRRSDNRPLTDIGKILNRNFAEHYIQLNAFIKQSEFIVLFIDNSEISNDRKRFYMDYFSRTIDENGKLLLAFYGISAEGQHLKDTFEEYKFFSDLRLIFSSPINNSWNIPTELGSYYPHLQEVFDKQKQTTTISHRLTFNFTT